MAPKKKAEEPPPPAEGEEVQEEEPVEDTGPEIVEDTGRFNCL